MNRKDVHRLIVGVGAVISSALASGCAGGAGSPPTATSFAQDTHARRALGTAHSNQKLFISNIDGSVIVYSAGSKPSLLQTIVAGVPRPGGIWVDKRGALYAVNVPDGSYQTSLAEYKPGTDSPFRTITNGIVNCGAVAVDSRETTYVTGIDTSNGSFFLEIYPEGKRSPSQTLAIPHSGVGGPAGLAFDSSGALLVGELLLGSGAVYRLPRGSQTFTNLNLRNAPGGSIGVDKAGNLYVGGNNAVAVYASGATRPKRTIRVRNLIDAITVAPSGELYVASTGSIAEYAPGAKEPGRSFNVEALVGGLALGRNG